MKLFTTILISALFFCSIASADQANILEPDAEIGQAVTDQLQQGRWELVMFWATYCPICKRDFVKLDKFFKDNPEIPITIVGVVADGVEQKKKALTQIKNRELNYSHILTDFEQSKQFFQTQAESNLIGVPSYLLYNTENEMVGFNHHSIDVDALEIYVYE